MDKVVAVIGSCFIIGTVLSMAGYILGGFYKVMTTGDFVDKCFGSFILCISMSFIFAGIYKCFFEGEN